MWDVSHADDDSVWCYNDEYHCFLEFIAIGNILFINLYSNTLVLCKTILHKGNNVSFRKNGAVYCIGQEGRKSCYSYYSFLH